MNRVPTKFLGIPSTRFHYPPFFPSHYVSDPDLLPRLNRALSYFGLHLRQKVWASDFSRKKRAKIHLSAPKSINHHNTEGVVRLQYRGSSKQINTVKN